MLQLGDNVSAFRISAVWYNVGAFKVSALLDNYHTYTLNICIRESCYDLGQRRRVQNQCATGQLSCVHYEYLPRGRCVTSWDNAGEFRIGALWDNSHSFMVNIYMGRPVTTRDNAGAFRIGALWDSTIHTW